MTLDTIIFIQDGITATLLNGLSAALSGTVNVEFCRGMIAQAKAECKMFGGNWEEVESKIMSQLGDSSLMKAVSMGLLYINET
jgi:hypothetical protein